MTIARSFRADPECRPSVNSLEPSGRGWPLSSSAREKPPVCRGEAADVRRWTAEHRRTVNLPVHKSPGRARLRLNRGPRESNYTSGGVIPLGKVKSIVGKTRAPGTFSALRNYRIRPYNDDSRDLCIFLSLVRASRREGKRYRSIIQCRMFITGSTDPRR